MSWIVSSTHQKRPSIDLIPKTMRTCSCATRHLFQIKQTSCNIAVFVINVYCHTFASDYSIPAHYIYIYIYIYLYIYICIYRKCALCSFCIRKCGPYCKHAEVNKRVNIFCNQRHRYRIITGSLKRMYNRDLMIRERTRLHWRRLYENVFLNKNNELYSLHNNDNLTVNGTSWHSKTYKPSVLR